MIVIPCSLVPANRDYLRYSAAPIPWPQHLHQRLRHRSLSWILSYLKNVRLVPKRVSKELLGLSREMSTHRCSSRLPLRLADQGAGFRHPSSSLADALYYRSDALYP